jgi:hypothetical protein
MENENTQQRGADGGIVHGIIYMITDTSNGKRYVGQTRTHKWNHGKYRPYGTRGRLRQHISQSKGGGGQPILKAIREHGAENFAIEEVQRCSDTDLCSREEYHICEQNTLAPNGYNVRSVCHKPSTSRKNPCNTDGLQAKRRKTYEDTDIVRAVVKTTTGCAPKVLVFFETLDKKTARTMPRTTFSTCVDPMEVAMEKALAFARAHTENVEILENSLERGEATRAGFDMSNVVKLIARIAPTCYKVFLNTGPDDRARTMRYTAFYPKKGDWDEAKTRLLEWATEQELPVEFSKNKKIVETVLPGQHIITLAPTPTLTVA